MVAMSYLSDVQALINLGELGVAADVRIFFKKNDFFAEFCALNGSREAGRTGADND